MQAGKTVRDSTARSPGWSRTWGLLNPPRAVWWLFTNVRFAIFLLVVVSLAALLGVVIPQLPLNVRGDVVAEADWLRLQHDRFGFLTDPMDRAGLFDVFHAAWFASLLGLTVAATGAYVISRFPGIWHAITRPRKRVPERYFDVAPNRAEVDEAVDIGRLEQLLRRQRYRVERFPEGATTYLFADRFQWAQLGTLLTHAAIIVFILSAVVSRLDSFSSPLFLSEGSTLPVFPVKDPQQMQVQLLDAHAEFAPDGQPLDYRSSLVVYQGGQEVLRCQSTVNSPCSYNGYKFYQAAYFGFGAAVQVKDLNTGNLIYRETLALADRAPAPHVVIKDAAGAVLLDRTLVLTDNLSTDQFSYSGALVTLPNGRALTIGLRRPAGGGDERLAVLEPGQGGNLAQLALDEGQTASSAGLQVQYVRAETVPSAVVPDFPLPPSASPQSTGEAQLQMSNVIYGTDRASEGTAGEAPAPAEPPQLTIVGLKPQAVTFAPGQAVTIDNYEYTFTGQSEFSGIQVKRDRSDYFVWAGAVLIIIGLLITFWVPRRRLWARITAARTSLAGQAASHARYGQELRRLLAAAGVQSPGTDVKND